MQQPHEHTYTPPKGKLAPHESLPRGNGTGDNSNVSNNNNQGTHGEQSRAQKKKTEIVNQCHYSSPPPAVCSSTYHTVVVWSPDREMPDRDALEKRKPQRHALLRHSLFFTMPMSMLTLGFFAEWRRNITFYAPSCTDQPNTPGHTKMNQTYPAHTDVT